MNFTSHVDTVVAAAVGLVNVATAGEAHGRSYPRPAGEDLRVAITEALHAGRSGLHPFSAGDAVELATMASRLRTVFEAASRGDVDAAASTVNGLLAETGARPQLDRHDGEPWHMHFHASTDSLADGWAAGCATGLAIVLGTEMYDRLGVCTAPRCDRVYVDVSRNGKRRFCSTSCQNRVKAAAFRARQS